MALRQPGPIIPPRSISIIDRSTGDEVHIDNLGNMSISGAITFDGVQEVEFPSVQDVQFTSTQNVQFPSAQSVQFDSTQNVSAVFPSAQDININGVTVQVGRSPNLAYFDKSSAWKTGDETGTVGTLSEATEYSELPETWAEKKDWGSISFDTYGSGITSSLKVTWTFEGKNTKVGSSFGHDQGAKITEDAGDLIVKQGATYFPDDTYTETSVTEAINATSGTFQLKTYLQGDTSFDDKTAWIKNQVLAFSQVLNKTTINDTDIGAAGGLFIKSITLPQDCTVRLDDDQDSILFNSEATDKIIDYSSAPIQFSKIEILAGTPSFVLVEAD